LTVLVTTRLKPFEKSVGRSKPCEWTHQIWVMLRKSSNTKSLSPPKKRLGKTFVAGGHCRTSIPDASCGGGGKVGHRSVGMAVCVPIKKVGGIIDVFAVVGSII